MLKVLFLDIDGVVLHGQALWATGNNRHLPPEKIALIREVCDRSGAIIVVSSTWRYSDDTRQQLAAAGLPLHRDWRTCFSRDVVGSIIVGNKVRGDEIAQWLAEHPEVGSYAIVDDDSDMLPEQRGRFVQTPFETGIDRSHVERLIACLASVDTRRMAETGTGSVRSTGSAVPPSAGDAITPPLSP